MGKLNKSEIISVLKTEMDNRGIKKTALAEQIGLNRKTIGEALKKDGNPTIDTLMKIADALDFDFRLIDSENTNAFYLSNNREWLITDNSSSTENQITVKDLKNILKDRGEYSDFKKYLYGYSYEREVDYHEQLYYNKRTVPDHKEGLLDHYKEIKKQDEYNYKYLSEIAYDVINALKDLCDMLDLDNPRNLNNVIDLDIIDNIIGKLESLQGQAEFYGSETNLILDNYIAEIRATIEECIEATKKPNEDEK